MRPGERSGEHKLLSPGKEPATATAPPQGVPLPSHDSLAKHSAFKPDADKEARQEADKAGRQLPTHRSRFSVALRRGRIGPGL